jgi:hypothetical protein
MNYHKTSGNVLFLILIAVALFAALSYVVINSTRSGSSNVDNENSKLLLAQMDNIAVAMASSALAKKTNTNCTTDEIMNNFCAPTPSGCGWVARAECNIVATNDPFAPRVRWEYNAGWYIALSKGKQILFWLDDGEWQPGQEKLVYAAFFSDNNRPENFKPAELRKVCETNNSKSGLLDPASIAAMNWTALGNYLSGIGMTASTCVMPADNSYVTWYYPITKE